MSNIELKNSLSEKQLSILKSEMDSRKTNTILAWILWFFLGGLGIHSFYLGDKSRGIKYLIFTFVGSLLAILIVGYIFLIIVLVMWIKDAINMSKNIEAKDSAIELEILNSLNK